MQDEVRREVERHDAVIGIGPVSLIRRRGERSPVVVPEQDGSEEEEQNEQKGELDELSPVLGNHDPQPDRAAACSAGEEKTSEI
jgi:hypothetical protein